MRDPDTRETLVNRHWHQPACEAYCGQRCSCVPDAKESDGDDDESDPSD